MFYLKENMITLREFTADDIDNKVKWINDNANNQYLHYDIPLNREKTLVWFQSKAKNRLDCVIEYDGTPVGLIGLIGIDETNRKAEFYISMGRTDFKRKGIATIATRMLLKYAFGTLGLIKVFLHVDEENVAARGLYEKIGFTVEGRFIKDMLHRGVLINRCRYAIFSETMEELA